jgi:hypothetical protein
MMHHCWRSTVGTRPERLLPLVFLRKRHFLVAAVAAVDEDGDDDLMVTLQINQQQQQQQKEIERFVLLFGVTSYHVPTSLHETEREN